MQISKIKLWILILGVFPFLGIGFLEHRIDPLGENRHFDYVYLICWIFVSAWWLHFDKQQHPHSINKYLFDFIPLIWPIGVYYFFKTRGKKGVFVVFASLGYWLFLGAALMGGSWLSYFIQ